MDSMPVVLLATFINRLTEVVKKAFLNDLSISDDRKSALVLFLSLLLGALGVVFIFPSANLITGLGASQLAEQIVTGIIIGGLANGINFFAGVGSAVVNKISGADTDKSIVTVEHKTVDTKEIKNSTPSLN